MPKGFFKIPNIKGDMAQKLLTMYGAHAQRAFWRKFGNLHPYYSSLLVHK